MEQLEKRSLQIAIEMTMMMMTEVLMIERDKELIKGSDGDVMGEGKADRNEVIEGTCLEMRRMSALYMKRRCGWPNVV